jgi:L-lysine exporter family protein LysE/ArgO
MSVLRAGLTLGFGLIISMGPQNIFLIRQGIKKEYAYLSALICSLCDMLLILISTLSVSQLIIAYPTVKMLLMIFGALFLIGYGAKSVYSGIKQFRNPSVVEMHTHSTSRSLIRLLITAISFSLLNPQAIIDTMIMIGGVVSQYPEEDQLVFIIGVIAASFLWFNGLATLSAFCAHILKNGKAWACLEVVSGLVMFGFSVALLNV